MFTSDHTAASASTASQAHLYLTGHTSPDRRQRRIISTENMAENHQAQSASTTGAERFLFVPSEYCQCGNANMIWTKPRVSHALRYAIRIPQVIHHLNMRDAFMHRPRPSIQHPASHSQLQQPLQDYHISRCSHHNIRGPGELITRSTVSTVTEQSSLES